MQFFIHFLLPRLLHSQGSAGADPSCLQPKAEFHPGQVGSFWQLCIGRQTTIGTHTYGQGPGLSHTRVYNVLKCGVKLEKPQNKQTLGGIKSKSDHSAGPSCSNRLFQTLKSVVFLFFLFFFLSLLLFQPLLLLETGKW